MRHRKNSLRLGRKPAQTRLIVKNLATSILLYERVRTTKKRAQVVKSTVDRIIAVAKSTERLDLAIRKISAMVSDKNACKKVLEVLKQRYENRTSGFTSITPLGMRHGDGAMLCEIALIDAATSTTTLNSTPSSK
jgi:large subunit ribosomal protein L17